MKLVSRRLIDVPPQGVQKVQGMTVFYYGAAPQALQSLPANAQFTMVYSPRDDEGWQVVRYRVIQPTRGYNVVERRGLEAEEIAHFEQLLKEQ